MLFSVKILTEKYKFRFDGQRTGKGNTNLGKNLICFFIK